MKAKIFFAATLTAFAASPAFAGVPVPGPEAGIGLASMALAGVGYVWLRKRVGRR